MGGGKGDSEDILTNHHISRV